MGKVLFDSAQETRADINLKIHKEMSAHREVHTGNSVVVKSSYIIDGDGKRYTILPRKFSIIFVS